MAGLDLPAPVRMQRIAVAVPGSRLRDALVRLAQGGNVELSGELPPAAGPANDALQRLGGSVPGRPGPARGTTPVVSAAEPDVATLESRGARDLLAGEVELDRRRRLAIAQDDVSVLLGWTPGSGVAQLRQSMAADGAAVVELPPPAELPPTLLRSTRLAGPFHVLVDTYGVLPYSDVDPTAFAALAFIVMFGMMFGDVGHGALLILLGLVLARVRRGRLAVFRPAWPLVVAAGAAGTVFGLLYGELFGPTHVVPSLWLAPLEQPLTLLKAAIVVGSLLLSVSYLLGFANRWREAGPAGALYAEGGLAGGLVFAGIAAAALGWSRGTHALVMAGVVAAIAGMVLVFLGTLFQAGGGFAGVTRAIVEVMDTSIRIGSNIISFTRLAAFGLTHAALSLVTLQAVQDLAAGGPVGWLAAAVVFVIGTLVALALEGMVASIQALRLEYYELFSRVFEEEGRPFTPFALTVRPTEDRA
jgi:V/A-type H+/Na+-transporting ATPase subunit I